MQAFRQCDVCGITQHRAWMMKQYAQWEKWMFGDAWQVNYIDQHLPPQKHWQMLCSHSGRASLRWLEAFPTQTANAGSTLEGVNKDICWHHGMTLRQEPDNVSHYKNTTIQEWVEWVHHQAAGKVELCNGLLKPMQPRRKPDLIWVIKYQPSLRMLGLRSLQQLKSLRKWSLLFEEQGLLTGWSLEKEQLNVCLYIK